MRFLKVLLWLLLGGLVTAFVIYNGDQRVNILLWGGLVADFSLPLLLIVIFLAGFAPMLVAYHALKWRSRQRVAGLERAIDDLRAVQHVPAPPPVVIVPEPDIDTASPTLPLPEAK